MDGRARTEGEPGAGRVDRTENVCVLRWQPMEHGLEEGGVMYTVKRSSHLEYLYTAYTDERLLTHVPITPCAS